MAQTENPSKLTVSGYFLYLVSDAFFKELTQLPELEFARDKIKVAPSQECVDRLLQATPYAIGTEFINEQWIREMIKYSRMWSRRHLRQREKEKFAPDMECCVLHGATSAKLSEKAQEELPFLSITTYGMAARLETLKEKEWDCLILDEAQAIKNPTTKQTREIKKMKSRMRIAMTGTPIENDLTNLWSLFDFLNHGLLGSFGEFREFCKGLEQHLEKYADYASRLDRGKRYVRTGTVVDLQIKTGKIEARVQGRRKTPYKVEIRISPLNQAHCQGISRSV